MFRSVTLLITFFLVSSLYAQEQHLRFRHLMDKDDLSSNSVLSICQDYRGFMWLGTRDGLNRYDGYEFRVYSNDLDDSTSISNDHVNIIYEDSRKNLWIGTGRGLNLFDRSKDRFVRFKPGKDSLSLSYEYVKTILEDNEGNIWVGTSRGLNRLNPESKVITQFISVPDEQNTSAILNVNNLYEDSRGNLWIGARNGLYLFKSGKLEPYYLNPATKEPAAVWIRKMYENKTGNLWIATEQHGVFLLNCETGEIVNYLHNKHNKNSLINNRVRTIFEDWDGRIWFGTFEGLSIFDPETSKFQNYEHSKYDPTSLSQNSIRDIIGDDAHGIWIATYAGGVNYYHRNNNIFIHIKEEFGTTNTLSYSEISYLYKDSEDILWIGTNGRGLNRHNETQGTFQQFVNSGSDQHIALDNITSLTEADNGILWLGTLGGLSRYNTQTFEFLNFIHDPADSNSLSYNQVHATLIDSKGNLWVGTNGGGLERYVPELNGFIHHRQSDEPSSIISNAINVILEDAEGKLWIGTHAGLDCFDPAANRFVELPDISGPRRIMPSTRIVTLFEDSHGRFWIGTQGRGLLLLNKYDYTLSSFTEKDGLPNDVVNAILEDDQSNLWISTNRGISRLSFDESLGDEEMRVSIKNFNESEGLQGLQFYSRCAFKDKEGRLYFGGVNGYNVFFPEQISDTLLTPKVVFTDFKIKYQTVKIDAEGSPLVKDISETENVTLDYSQREFSITFAGLNYLNPENIYYSYRLSGIDDQWIDIGNQRTITFAYLTPGQYELMVRASDDPVRASDDPNSWGNDYSYLKINVLPPPWRSWWAYLLYALVSTGILIGILFYTYRWLRLKNELALELINKEKEKELHQMKTRFFTDISHELRTPLTLILAPLDKLVTDLKGNFRLRNQLMMIQRNGKKMLALINQLLDLRKYETGHMKLEAARGNISRFVRETTLSFREIAKMKSIHFIFSESGPYIEAWYDRNKLEIVLYNLLSNAFKVTKAGGRMEVKISEVNGESEEFYTLVEKSKLSSNIASFVKITVEDSGKGIPPDLLKKIFDRFYQIDTKETSDSLSTGVGLELTKRMVELHGGVISVESTVAKDNTPGSTIFTILLPAGNAHLKPDQMIKDFRTSEDQSLYQKELLSSEVLIDQLETSSGDIDNLLDNMKDKPSMVVVEDNPEVCMFVRDLFKSRFKVHTAFDGKEGWELILKTVPDIIISDVMMPEMDGIELCRIVKTDKRISHIPVILLTARTAVTFKYEGLETGADDYIHKPFSAKYLMIRVNNLIRQRKFMQEHFFRNSLLKPEELAVTSSDEKILRKAIQNIEINIADPDLNVDSLSRDIGLSRVHFYRKIKFLTNMTAVEFIRTIRLKKAAQLLEEGKLNVSEIRYMVGIQDAEYFRTSFKKQFGLSPKEYATQNSTG